MSMLTTCSQQAVSINISGGHVHATYVTYTLVLCFTDAPGFPYPLGNAAPYTYDPKTGYPKPEVRKCVYNRAQRM